MLPLQKQWASNGFHLCFMRIICRKRTESAAQYSSHNSGNKAANLQDRVIKYKLHFNLRLARLVIEVRCYAKKKWSIPSHRQYLVQILLLSWFYFWDSVGDTEPNWAKCMLQFLFYRLDFCLLRLFFIKVSVPWYWRWIEMKFSQNWRIER